MLSYSLDLCVNLQLQSHPVLPLSLENQQSQHLNIVKVQHIICLKLISEFSQNSRSIYPETDRSMENIVATDSSHIHVRICNC